MLSELTSDECRVLGVMIEKAHTTPAQYPLTLNGLTTGCNQKSNRNPIVQFDEEHVQDVLDSLRSKRLAVMVDMSGSRVLKYKHDVRETMGLSTAELVILAELMLRGPQTVGELRTRSSRMHPSESLDAAQNVLNGLIDREAPLVKRLGAAPGSRAERYVQLLCPDLHPLEVTAVPATSVADAGIVDRVGQLEAEVAHLRRVLQRVTESLGEPQLLETPSSDQP